MAQVSRKRAEPPSTAAARETRERDLINIVQGLVAELRGQRATPVEVSLSSRLDRDLGIDSLGRTELVVRLERAFALRLSTQVIGEAETVRDLLAALGEATAQPHLVPAPPPTRAELPATGGTPSEARTLVEVLEWHVAQHPDRLHVTLFQDDLSSLGTLTYRELQDAARRVAAGLIERDILPGDRIALMLPTSLEFFIAFFAILYAGAVPVPIYPPARPSQIEDHLRRQAGILRNAGARILVTVPEGLRLAGLLSGQVDTLEAVETVERLEADPSRTALPPVTDGSATAFIQYTSGSTGDPKGVVLSHANLLANVRAMIHVLEATPADVFVSWLPLYHDLGLIGAWMGTLYCGVPLYVTSPLSFLVRPACWLKAIHHFRGTLSAAPNFAYELCLNKIPDAELEGLDLSSWRVVANGAEPIGIHTMRRFIEKFSAYGFRSTAMSPVYGLAENSVGLAFPPLGRGPVVERIDREALMTRGRAELARPDDPNALEVVACGQPLPDNEVRIVDETGHEVGERIEGRLEFRGPSMTSGYFRNEAKSRELFHDGWVNSGDRAYMAGGDIFITGRVKDIIIRAGRNIYPHEVEAAVGELPGMRKGGVAVFGTRDEASGTERLVVLAETRETDAAAREALRQRANDVAASILGEPADEIVLVAPRAVPKTSSGKVRRSSAKELYERGQLGMRQSAMWWQLARLWLSGIGPRLARFGRLLGNLLYAAWWWTVVVITCLIGWLMVLVLPRLSWRWAVVRTLARFLLFATGIPISTKGLERVPRGNAMLLFNHASYTDPLVLAAVLPGEPAFVGKREFASQLVAGTLLRRLGALFVERYDLAAGLADTQAATDLARQGRVIVFFPEGTFTRRTGLSEFFLGAFKVASDAGLTVFPGAVRGTRTMLRGDQWLPRRSAITIDVGEPIKPGGTDFAAVLALRDQARAAMLARCGEPDLGVLIKPPAKA
ncbi:MAG: AMP-binding protein [Xanthobacteraceae bacterium]